MHARVARFFLVQFTKMAIMQQMAPTYTKWPQHIQIGHKMKQMVVKDIKIIRSKAFQIVPKLGVWFGNKPSGNPGARAPCRTRAPEFKQNGAFSGSNNLSRFCCRRE
jgi:hypothetical protein